MEAHQDSLPPILKVVMHQMQKHACSIEQIIDLQGLLVEDLAEV